MSGLELFDGDTKLRITYGARTVLTTDGTLVNLLPQSMDISETFDIVFPDFSKDYLYQWRHVFSYNSLANQVGYRSDCGTSLTIPKQDFDSETSLVSAPSGADIFVGKIRLTRTSAPSHTWNAETIQPLQPTGVDIPFFSGSLLMEVAFGMSRAFSIYVSGGQLRLHRQQSVATPPGGWGMFGTSFNYLNAGNGSGGENVNGGQEGLPVLAIDARASDNYQQTAGLFADPYSQRSRRGYTGFGANVCTIPNPSAYNYGSTYQATLTGSFGRRS